MESLLDFTNRTSQKMADSGKYEFVYLRKDYDDTTRSENRRTLSTQIIKAIRKKADGRIFNKVEIKTVRTDLVLNFKETGSTKETHEKKIQKTIQKLGVKIEAEAL